MTTHNIVSVSGGKDSTATLLLAMVLETENLQAVFADTGNEHELTYEYLDYLEQVTGVGIIYHANCADGFGAAWVVRRLCPDTEFHAAKHGEPAPSAAGKHVVIVDFSYPLDTLQNMASTALSVLIIDHHKTAQEALSALPQTTPDDLEKHQLAAFFDMERSGAGLTWDYFYPSQPRPALINHIEDRDLWRFKLEGTREILANLFSHPQDFEVWDELMVTPVSSLRSEDAAIERSRQRELADLLRATQLRLVIAGFDVPAANLPFTQASDAGHIMCAGEPFAAIYWDTPTGRSFSLRSADTGEDVSAIAKQYGGGGHRNAAGFTVPYGHALTLQVEGVKITGEAISTDMERTK